MKLRAICLMTVVAIGATPAWVRADGLTLQPVASGLPGITSIVNAADGSGRLFITLQDGRIVIRSPTGILPTPFLDIRPLVRNGGESGLLGLAFHRNYATKPFFYVDYIDLNGRIVVARYAPSATDPNVADPASQSIILTIPKTYTNHNGGQLQFGPDGFLYVGVGDGGGEGDPLASGQSLNTLFGKILRIDVDNGTPYAIPASNPFRLTPGAKPEIWAYGLRNPWRFTFDRTTGDLFIGDVGQDRIEEIDFQPAGSAGGQNYGWRTMEGSLCFNPASGCSTSGITLPVMEYTHLYGCSVVGGYRYRGSAIAGMGGVYLFGDYCDGTVWAARRDAGGVWGNAPVVPFGSFISTFGEDEAGEIYVGDASYGTLLKVVPGARSLSIGGINVTEGNTGTTQAVFTVFLLPASGSQVKVDYATFGGNAQPGSDFTDTSGTLTFPPGSTSATITVPILADDVYEIDEYFGVSLTNPLGATIVPGAAQGWAFIRNDDRSLSVADLQVSEGDSGTKDAKFTVSLLGPPSTDPVTVDFATQPGTAVAGEDYLDASGTLTFPPGATTATMVVPIVGDILVEGPDTFTVTLSNPVNATMVRAAATGTIQNDDLGPLVEVDDVTIPEGDSGTTNAVFTVTLSRSSTQTVTVGYQTAPVGAGSPADFLDTSGTLTFLPGVTTQTVPVTVLGDVLSEANETFVIYLIAVTNATVQRSTGSGTIVDDDPLPELSLDSVALAEGDSGQQYASFAVHLSAPSGQWVTAPFATSPGTAQEGSLQAGGGSAWTYLISNAVASPYPSPIEIPTTVGSIRRVTVTLSLSNAVDPGALGSFDVLLVGPQGQSAVLMSDVPGGLSTTSVNLVFDDDGPALPPGPVSSGSYRPTNYDPEGDLDSFEAPAPAGPYGSSLSVFQASNPSGTWKLYIVGDAKSTETRIYAGSWGLQIETDADYARTTGTLSIPPGNTLAYVSVPVAGDRTKEPDETFNLDLSSPVAATLLLGHAVGTIVNDDQLALRIGDNTLPEGNEGTTDGVFTVRLDQPGTDEVTVDYTTVDGTATTGDGDYGAAGGTLVFPPGETTASIHVPVHGDTWNEGDEAFTVVLSAPANAGLARGTAQGFIPNDDPVPSLAIGEVLAFEGDTATFAVSLSAGSRDGVTVAYSTADGSARAGVDYTAVSGVLTFPTGATTETIEVPILADGLREASESFFVNLSVPVHATLANASGKGWILDPATASHVQFASAHFATSERARSANILVKRTGDTRQPATMAYETSAGSARPGIDYVPTAGVLTFPASATVRSFAVPLLNDTGVDGPATVLLSIRPLEGPVLAGTPNTAVLTIGDDDRGGTLAFGKSQYQVNESAGQAVITVVRKAGLAGEVTVDYAASEETATEGVDYQPTSGTLTFGPGITSRTFTVPVLADAQAEGSERVALSLSNPEGGALLGTPSSATLTLADAQPTVEFASSTFAARETSSQALITVNRSGPVDGPASVAFATSDGSALQGTDYIATSGTLSFAPGKASAAFPVRLLNDRVHENSPTILLHLDGPLGAVLGAQSTAVLTVGDDDAAGTLQFGASHYQVNDRMPAAVITVTRTGGLAEGVGVDYATADGTAAAGTLYSPSLGQLQFHAGIAKQTFSVPLLDDPAPHGDETVLLSLGNPTGGASLGSRTAAILTITSSDPIVQFSAPAYTVAAGAPSATITVTRSGPTTGSISVGYETSDGSATAGEDYVTSASTLTFADGVKVQTFTVPILVNAGLEGNETVNLRLVGPTGGAAVGTRSQAVLTIATDDPLVQWKAATAAVAESAASVALVVRRLGPTTTPFSVDYATSDLSANAGSDYVQSTGTLTFGAGAVSQTVRVPLVNDAPDEADETFAVTLSNPDGAVLGAPSTATITIKDNDVAGVISLAAADYSVRESDGFATVTVNRTRGSAGGATVEYAVGGGTAVAGSNYEATSGTLVFGPGEMSKTIVVPILDDGVTTSNLYLGLSLSNPGGKATLGAQTTAHVWIVQH